MMNSATEKRRVAIYVRVSTQEQQRDGYSLGDQKRKLTEYVNNNPALNLTTKDEWYFEDVGSGSDLNRPAYEAMMKLVAAKEVDAILVWKIDRLSRNLRHLLGVLDELKKHEVSFISMQENLDFHGPMGRLIFQIFGALAEFERTLIQGRTQSGKLASAHAGNYVGSSIPYGYDKIPNPTGKGNILKLIPKEVAIVERIFKSYIHEGKGQLVISNELNVEGIPLGKHTRAKKNFKWDEGKIETILTDEHYIGRYVISKTDLDTKKALEESHWIRGECPQIISETTYFFAQEQRKKNLGGRTNTDYLLSGKLYDMSFRPPKKFVGAGRTRGGNSYRRQAFWYEGVKQKVNEIAAKPLEDYVWQRLLEAFKDPTAFVEQYYKKQITDSKSGNLQKELDQIKKRLKDLEKTRDNLEEKYINAKISDEAYGRQSDKIEAALSAATARKQKREKEIQTLAQMHVKAQVITDVGDKVKLMMANLDHEKKRWIMQLMVERINVYTTYSDTGKEVGLEVCMKFNPKSWAQKQIVRTPEYTNIAKKETLGLDFDVSGGDGGN